MLRNFRAVFKGNQTPMAIVMGAVLVSLVISLSPGRFSLWNDGNVVARVYGREILQQDLDQYVKQMAQMYRQRIPNIEKMMPLLRNRALSDLVNQKIIEELAERHGTLVTEQELADGLAGHLKRIPYCFNQDGSLKPSTEIDQLIRELKGITLKDLERETAREILIKKWRNYETAKVPVDEAWLALENRIQNEKITFEAATLAPDINAIPDPGDAKLQAFQNEAGARFQVGARRIIQYVIVDKAVLGDALKVDDATLRAAYESKKHTYTEYKPSHILFKATAAAEFTEAGSKAAALRQKLISGEKTFAATAGEINDDAEAKKKNGDLGWTQAGMMVKPFEDAALALKDGDISQPVRTQYGIHLIRLEGKRVKPFDEVKETLRSQISQDRYASKAKEKLEQLRKRCGEKGDLNAPAKNLGLKCQLTKPFLEEPGTGIAEIPNSGVLMNDAFGLKLGQVSKVHPVGDAYAVIRPREEKAPSVPPLAEIRAKVLAAWKLEEARKAAFEKAKGALASGDLKALGAVKQEENKTLSSLGELSKHPAIRKALLETKEGGFTPVLWNPEGQVWVAKLVSRKAPETLTFEKRQALVKEMQSQVCDKLLEAELTNLKQQGELSSGFSSLWGKLNGIWVNPESKTGRDMQDD